MPIVEPHPFPPSERSAAPQRRARGRGGDWRGYLATGALAMIMGALAGAFGGAVADKVFPAGAPAAHAARVQQDVLPSAARAANEAPQGQGPAGASSPQLAVLAQEIAALRQAQEGLQLGLRLLPGGPPQTEALRLRLLALEASPPVDATAQQARASTAQELRIAALEKSLADMTRQNGAMRADLARLEGRSKSFAQGADVDGLRAQLGRLDADVIASRSEAASARRAARGAFAVAAAAEAAQRSGPFVEAVRTLTAAFPQDAQVAALSTLALQGAPSRSELLASFGTLDDRIDRALRAQASGPGLLGSMQAAISQQVSVRPVTPKGVPRTPLDGARAAVAIGDLAGTVTALAQLDGQAALEARPWLDGARRRLEIDARLAAIRAELLKG